MTISSTSSSSESSHQSALVLDIGKQQVPNLVATAAAAAAAGGGGGHSEVVFVKCDCCGLTEECTETYIAKVRERYQGRWICGLCAEAVKDEILRSADQTIAESLRLMISIEEALNRHMNFCNKFRSSTHPPPNPTKHLISAMKQLLRRSLTTTTTTTTTTTGSSIRSTPTSPHHSPRPKDIITEPRHFSRSESCFPTYSC